MKTRELILAALFCALTAVFSQLIIPTQPVPFSLSITAVFICGAMLSPRAALLAQVAYLLLGAAGLPIFAGFRGGLGALFGPTGGYLMAYPLMALIVALVRKALKKNTIPALAAGMLAALLCCYAIGSLWLAHAANMSLAAALSAGVVPFILLDIVKAALSAALSSFLIARVAL